MKPLQLICLPLIPVALFFSACKPKEQASALPVNLPEDFTTFYQRFLKDSLYQMEHIVFPLEGIPDHADSLTIAGREFRWQKEDWLMHKPVDPAHSDFDIYFEIFGDDIVTENMIHRSGQYAIMRRYAKQDGEWNLIYYAGLNSIRE
ncbi:MAG TPA: hypothetical protein PKE06_07400 [Flavilitoribacter sp.]|nr:hypothetical protein [Flavilitoribacter sp.]HMQ87237.1 hypothetical protein [Flavilitoribacter sp.]